MEEQDITKTGPVGLKGLKGLNRQEPSKSEAYRISGFRGNIGQETAMSPALFEPQHRAIDDPLASWGSSKYDIIAGGMGDEATLNESRYENQSTVDAMANAVGKMLGTAATTFISGVLNPIVGASTAISEGRWSGLWDNELTKALSDADKYMEDNYKIYQSLEQQNASWLSATNLTSASFWGDDVIKNAGFMLGAAAAGATFTGGLGLASSAFGLAKAATNSNRIATKLLGSIFSAAGEGAIEAKHTMEDLVELNNQRLDDALGQEAQRALDEYNNTKGTLVQGADGNYYDPAYVKLQQTIEDLNQKRILGQQQIIEDARSAGNWDMALNIPILTMGNFITMGKGFTKSFNNARKMSEAINRADGANLIRGFNSVREGARKAFSQASKGEPIESGLETTVKAGKGRKAWEFVKPIISEGSEEMNQQWASSFAGYYKGTKEDANDYWKAKMDPAAEQDAMSAWTALGKGFFDSWGSFDQWEQFFVGGLTGAVGMPMPTKTFNQDKTKKRYDPRRYFSWEGGSFQSLKDFKNRLNSATEASEALNKRVNDSNFWNRIRSGVAHSYFQTEMDDAVANDDIKSYKDNEEKQFVQDLEAFAKAGKLNDFITIIDEATQNLNDEDVEDLINRNTITISKEQDVANKRKAIQDRIENLAYIFNKDSSKMKDAEKQSYMEEINSLTEKLDEVNGEEQKISLYTDNKGNLTKSYNEIKQELQRNGEKLKERVNSYTQSIDLVNRMSNGRLTSDQEGNLAYLHYMGKAARNRAEALIDKYSNEISALNEIVLKTEEPLEKVQKKLGLADGVLSKKDDKTLSMDLTRINKPEAKRTILLDLGFSYNEESAKENLRNLYESNSNNIYLLRDLMDTIKLNIDSKRFAATFESYMQDPSKVDEDKQKAQESNNKEINEAKVDNMETPEIVESMENGDLEGLDLNFDESDLAILNGGNPEATEEEKQKAERKQKLNNAKKIVDTKKRAKDKARTLAKNDAQFEEIASMLDEASKTSETPDDLLDLDTEAFNDLDKLPINEEEAQIAKMLQEEGNSPEEIEEVIRESKKQRLDEAKGVIEEIKSIIEEENGELESLPNPNMKDSTVVREFEDTESADPTEKGGRVNKNNVGEKTSTPKANTNPITPDISNQNILNEAFENATMNMEKGYWKTNTTEYPIHRNSTDNNPYYTKVSDPKKKAVYKAIYDYLQEAGAFARRNNNEVKRNQKVKFAISKRLNNTLNGLGTNTAVLILDENNNVIGDLPNPFDKAVFDSYRGLDLLYNKAEKYFKEHSNDTQDDLVIIPDVESLVSRIYIGRPLYSANREIHTLNEISEGRPFKLAIALTSSPNPNMVIESGRRRSQGRTAEEMTIVPPEEAKAGQPYLLIQTSDERRKWIPVPITMPRFGETSRNSKLYNKVVRLINELSNQETTKNQDAILKWKDRMKDLLAVDDIYLEQTTVIGDNGPQTEITFRVKKLSTDTAWTTVYNGVTDTNAIISSLEALRLSYQISRKYINGEFEGESYNNLIGELANTNLEIGALHSVNDFFTINPIIGGKSQKADIIKDSERLTKDAINEANKSRAKEFVDKVIIPNQIKIDRSKTDKDFYYIKEDDGKYHKYNRVHNILPENSNGVSRHGNRGLNTGNAVDKIIRDFFNTGKTERPESMSEAAYNQLLDYVKTLDKFIKDNKWTIYANNIVFYQKYSDGRRVAGEVDLLLIDNEGNYHIYDIKTSAYSFYTNTFNTTQPQWGQAMSTKDYYTAQQSSYAKLFSDQYNKKISSVNILPFVIGYSSTNDQLVESLAKEKTMELPIVDINAYFNSAVTESGTSVEDDFMAALGALEGQKTSQSTQTVNREAVSTMEPEKNLRETSLQKIKSTRLFNTPSRKALLNKLSDDTLSEIANMKPILLSVRLNKIDTMIKPNMSNEEIDNLVRKQLGSKLNRAKSKEAPSDINKEVAKIRKMIPSLNREDAIRVIDTLIGTEDGQAWGQFKNGIITLYKNAAKGTAYHEAFHYVFNTLMSDSEINEAYKAARQQFGDLDAIALEERMAEDFREYMQNGETFIGRLKNIWRNLKNLLNKLKGNWNYLDGLYANISREKYKESLRDTTNIRNRLTKEQIQFSVETNVNNSNVNKTRVGKNKAWGKLIDALAEEGYIVKGYYNRAKKGYIVASVKEATKSSEAAKIRQYHRDKLSYMNLTQEQKEYLRERHISPRIYNNMTIEEKEVLFECMY